MARSARKSGNRAIVREGLVDEPLTSDQLHKLAALDDILTFLVLGREYAWERWPRRTSKVDLGTVEHGVDTLTATREDLRQTLQKLKDDTAGSLGNGLPPALHARLFDCWIFNLAQTALIASTAPTPAVIQSDPSAQIAFSVRAHTTVKTKTGKELSGWDQLVVEAMEGTSRNELVDSGLDAEHLIKTEKGGGWKFCLGPGTLFRKVCGHCFTVSSMDQRTPAFSATSILTWQVDKGNELFRQGGASVRPEDCPEPQHAYNFKHYSPPSQSRYARPLALVPDWKQNEPIRSFSSPPSEKGKRRTVSPPVERRRTFLNIAASTRARLSSPLAACIVGWPDENKDVQASQASRSASDMSSATRPSTPTLHTSTSKVRPPESVSSRSETRCHDRTSLLRSGSTDRASRPEAKIRKSAPISLHSDLCAAPPTPISPALIASPGPSSGKKRKRARSPDEQSIQSAKHRNSALNRRPDRPQPVPQQYDDFDDSIEVDDIPPFTRFTDGSPADTGVGNSHFPDATNEDHMESRQPIEQDEESELDRYMASAPVAEEDNGGDSAIADPAAAIGGESDIPATNCALATTLDPLLPTRDLPRMSAAVPCDRCSELSCAVSFAIQQLHSSYQRTLREQRTQSAMETSALCTSLKDATDNLHLHRTQSEERARRLYLAHDAAIAERDRALRLRQEAASHLSQVEHERDNIAADRAEAHRQLQAMMLESSKLQQVKDCLTVELDQAVTELREAKAGMGDLGAGRAYLEAERDSWAARVNELERDIDRVAKEKEEVMTRLEAMRKKVEFENEQLGEEKEASEGWRKEIQELSEAKKEAQEENKSLEVQRDNLTSEKETLRLELSRTKAGLEEAIQSRETAEQKQVAVSEVLDELCRIQEDSLAAMTHITSERDEAVKEKNEAVKEMEESFRTNLAELLAAKNNEEAALKEAETLRRRLASVLAEHQTLILASRAKSTSKATSTTNTNQVDEAPEDPEESRRQMEAIGYARDAAVKEKDRLIERHTKATEMHKKELESRNARIRSLEGRLAELDRSGLPCAEMLSKPTVTSATPPRRHQPLSDTDSVTRSPTAIELSDHAAIKRRIKQQGIEIRALRNANKVLQSRNDSTAQSSEDIMAVTQNIERRNIELQARMEDIVRAVVGPRSMSDGSVSVVPVSYHLAVQMNRIADLSLRGAGNALPEKGGRQWRRVRGTASLPILLDRVSDQQDHDRVHGPSQSRPLTTGLPVSAARTSTTSIAPNISHPQLSARHKPSSELGTNLSNGNASSSAGIREGEANACSSRLPNGQVGNEDWDDQTDCEEELEEGNGSEASIPPSPLLNGETKVSGQGNSRTDREPSENAESQQADRQESREMAEQRWRGLPAIRLPSLGIFR